jgi:hypothetical protein
MSSQRRADRNDPGSPVVSPARAALARAIEEVDSTQNLLEDARKPVDRLSLIAARARSQEAIAISAEVSRLREALDAEIAIWVDAGATGDRPAPSQELLAAERRLGELVSAGATAGAEIVLAEEDYVKLAVRAQSAAAERDQALWQATIEAAEPLLMALQQTRAVERDIEARLFGLVSALREIGNSPSGLDNAALRAAEKIEVEARAKLRLLTPACDVAAGHSLIGRLRSDPLALY